MTTRSAGIVVAALLLAMSGCSRSQESQVRGAVASRFPAGMRRCLGLASDTVGIHADGGPTAAAFYFPSTGVTDPLRRAYVFYAGFVGAHVPELVEELVAAGKLHRSVVQATADFEVQGPGRETISPTSGLRVRPVAYRHESRVLPVAVYETAAQDPDFDYRTRFAQREGMMPSANGFPSRMYAGPLPPADTHYRVPVIEPYATSVVAGACVPENLSRVLAIRKVTDWGGTGFIQADVEFSARPPDWMSTPAFRRATMGPETEPLDTPRRVTILFDIVATGLMYSRELGRP